MMEGRGRLWEWIVGWGGGKFEGVKVIRGGEGVGVGVKLGVEEVKWEVKNEYGGRERRIYWRGGKVDE
ncbi:hypothetical protein, partial [Paenibacillus sp. Y412MC10]|uniref:hypothetical protein n=1 Tax=Geobacillus sp. (strain Y412MC10) TaxID=481743 RepID=UPI00119E44F2